MVVFSKDVFLGKGGHMSSLNPGTQANHADLVVNGNFKGAVNNVEHRCGVNDRFHMQQTNRFGN